MQIGNFLRNVQPVILLFCSVLATVAQAESRVALVIGNSHYAFSPLGNPVNDASDMGRVLKKLGFDVLVYTDVDRKQMRQAIREFGEKLKKSDVGLFYFAGHGVQIRGKNYLVPISADVSSADEVEDESIDAGSVLRKMETAGNAVNIVILDACRNNPFARSFRSAEQGLARMEGPVGSLIAYATAPGSVAADGSGRNGLYTQYLLAALQQPGLSIEQTFKQVRNGVRKDTGGKQIPWESSSLTGEFVFLAQDSSQTMNKFVPPPVVPEKYLQVISNVPEAQVAVNNVSRGITDYSGVLNISGLHEAEVEVEIKARGYAPQHRMVKLMAGQWQTLKVNLHREAALNRQSPNSSPPGLTAKPDKAQFCLSPGRAQFLSRVVFKPLDGKPEIRYNSPHLFAGLHNAVKKYHLELINTSARASTLLNKKISTADAAFYQKMAQHSGAKYLLIVFLRGREVPIKAVKTRMKTIAGELTLELLDLNTGLTLAAISRDFKKPGLDMHSVMNEKIRQNMDKLITALFTRACAG